MYWTYWDNFCCRWARRHHYWRYQWSGGRQRSNLAFLER